MKVPSTIFILALAGLCPGCLIHQATEVVVSRTFGCLEETKERKQYRKLAEEVWNEVGVNPDAGPFSSDHAEGFKDGFADYLFDGGCGEPPLLPPHRYRKLRYRTPEGYRAAEEWFEGFRHGAAAAQEGGYRRYVLGPTSLSSGFGFPTLSTAPTLPPVPMMPPGLTMPPTDESPPARVPIRVKSRDEPADLPMPRPLGLAIPPAQEGAGRQPGEVKKP
jgi:hypothetical protein